MHTSVHWMSSRNAHLARLNQLKIAFQSIVAIPVCRTSPRCAARPEGAARMQGSEPIHPHPRSGFIGSCRDNQATRPRKPIIHGFDFR